MRKLIVIVVVVWLTLLLSLTFGEPSYRGFSGAPGSSGSCASSCHGNSGGTIQIEGFPEEFIAGETYNITISHASGNSIRQFNGSCRQGSGSANAGTISAGANTSTYSVSGESNGIRFSSQNQNTGIFDWTAPDDTTSEVRLYIAGLQGGQGGQNTSLVLVSARQNVDISDLAEVPKTYLIAHNYPNPFNAQTNISFVLPSERDVKLEIYNLMGQVVDEIYRGHLPAGSHAFNWNAGDFSSGIYLYKFSTEDDEYVGSMTLIK
ncbi:MAG: T9SS type A sorting domain-containing protein [candidate division Zixibacteria bacterium]|nr:T9SS type A sorting domain-containing protein [candidate division Zixibacteria bacterium]